MSEDWNGIAAEVADALASIGSTPEGFVVVLRQAVEGPRPEPSEPGERYYVYTEFVCLQDLREIKDQNGNLLSGNRHTLYLNATAREIIVDGETSTLGGLVVPRPGDDVTLGATVLTANDDSVWLNIQNVRPVMPADVAVMYEVDLVS